MKLEKGMEKEICLVYSTFGSFEDAKRVGKILVEERLVACVNVIPKIFSTYWWEGKVEEDEESLMIAKTLIDKSDEVVKRIKELHPYELPAILVIPIHGGLEDFVDYIREEVDGS